METLVQRLIRQRNEALSRGDNRRVEYLNKAIVKQVRRERVQRETQVSGQGGEAQG